MGGYPPPTYAEIAQLGERDKSWVQVLLSAPLTLNVPPQKATHLLGGFLRSLSDRCGSDFCEKLTFRENFSQKNFLKKFSNFPENRLTTPRKCDII